MWYVVHCNETMQECRKGWHFCPGCHLCTWAHGCALYRTPTKRCCTFLLWSFLLFHSGIDTTFNLGEVSVTPTVYRHLLLHDPNIGQSPLCLGPILYTSQSNFAITIPFFLHWMGWNKNSQQLRPLAQMVKMLFVEAAICNFPQSALQRCFRHLQQNIEQFLCEEQFPPAIIKLLVGDIFGSSYSDNTYHEGLVDSCDAETFDAQLSDLKEKWDHHEK